MTSSSTGEPLPPIAPPLADSAHQQVARGVLNGMAAGALWGLIFLIPLLLQGFNAWQLSAARYLVYGVVALGFLLPRRTHVLARVGRAEWLALLGLSLLGNIVYYVFLVLAVQWAGSAPSALIIGLIPVVVTLVGSRQHGAIGLSALLAPLALCMTGVAAVALHSLGEAGTANADTSLAERAAGLLCAAGALLCWSAYSIWNRRWLTRRPDISPWDWSLLTGVATGALALLLAIPAFGGAWLGLADDAGTAHSAAHSSAEWLRFWLITGTLAILASVVGNSFWNRASRQLPLTMIGQMIVFETVFALIYGFIYAGRWPDLLEWLATLSLVGGVLWCAHVHQRAGSHAH
ncbi:DMT family transporter [Corticibacter populi]|uniref:DMT family transporter n=1 Tax=Corticibacter populi TaxID=1550736 RepID=UPI001F5FF207|nr:DMT family transporter [Corticibacter populi]